MDNTETMMARCLRLESELAEERQQKYEALHREYERREELKRKLDDCLQEVEEQAKLNGMGAEREANLLAKLAATQADNERLRGELNKLADVLGPRWCLETGHVSHLEALSRPINLDALNEVRAEVADGAAAIADMFEQEGIGNAIRRMAAAYRAKKEG